MRLTIDGPAWNRGFDDGERGLPLRSCPYDVGTTESCSWSSGYIEGKAVRTVTQQPDASRSRRKKPRPPLRLEQFRYAPQLQPQRRKTPAQAGSILHADRGSKFRAD